MTENILYLLEIGKIDKDEASKYIDFNGDDDLAKESEMTGIWNTILKDKEKSQNLLPFYQAIIDKNDDVVGYECLIRMKNLDGDIITPDNFLQLSKKMGFYNQLTVYLIDMIIKDIKTLDKDIYINLDKENIANSDFVEMLIDKITKSHIKNRIVFEFPFAESIIPAIIKMKDNGLRVGIDNFNLGFNEIQIIKKSLINFEYIKTSKGFISGMQDDFDSCVSYIDLISSIGSKIIINFIETKTQKELIENIGVNFYKQGYYIARPADLENTVNIKK
jgi:EAL domain-containing protein (putative c-di-GMP-specific phosphodiesterase class I)